MADDREPPPLFDDDEKSEEKVAETNKESSEPAALEEDDDLFAGGGTEVSLDDPPEGDSSEPAKLDSEPAKLDAEPSSPLTKDMDTSDAAAVKEPEGAAGGDGDGGQTKMEEEDEVDDDESRDKFDIEITITEPQKMGDGMSAYMAYKVTTKTNDPSFKGKEMCVTRRFSDFLGLHQKLVEKHTCKGRIVPPAPEKSVVGMTKVKMSKSQEQTNSMEFIGKRRAALERFLNRTAAHPILYTDSDFREFLEKDDLPKATSTSALSGAGVMRAFTKVVDSASKVVSRMNESDQWFEEKQHMIDSLDAQLKKLHASVESMVSGRKELANTTSSFAKSAAMLGNSEEHTALSRAISQLAETEEKIEALHSNQAATDFYVLSELLKDYIGLLAAVREAFREREKSYLTWQNAQTTLSKKRDLEAKLKVSGKPEKLQQVQEEIKDWKMSKSQEQTNSMEFIGKRRAALERFLNRTAAHPILYTDSDFREFLEKDDLPKATSTSALSGAGVMRAFTKVVDSASKVVSRMNESDQWFEEKQHMIDSLDAQLKKLHASVESMVSGRKELANTTSSFAKSAAMLGNSEEHTALSRAISQLAETEEKIEALHSNQAATDFYVLSELLKDYIGLLAAVREAFREREKSYLTWQNAQTTLSKKRDLEAKLKVSGKPEKLQQVQEEIKDWTNKEVKGQEDFETVSKTLRREIKRFESNRVRDFRTVVIKYLESLMNHQQQLIQYWEAFLPEATAIA
ncbi:uncharacterized protein [Diadema setosum]|uniref:uncharacterized protein n=1 Tax=Diadema setosum TaxID=31175 RepID=UPI003B3B4FCB